MHTRARIGDHLPHGRVRIYLAATRPYHHLPNRRGLFSQTLWLLHSSRGVVAPNPTWRTLGLWALVADTVSEILKSQRRRGRVSWAVGEGATSGVTQAGGWGRRGSGGGVTPGSMGTGLRSTG